jgi:hypothetical protein
LEREQASNNSHFGKGKHGAILYQIAFSAALKSKPGSDSTHRRLVQHDGSSVQFGDIPYDRQPEARAWSGLIGADAALEYPFALIRIQARDIITDSNDNSPAVIRRPDGDARRRPFAGVVEEIAVHFIEIFALGLNRVLGRDVESIVIPRSA